MLFWGCFKNNFLGFYLWAIFAFKLDTNVRVAWYIAAGVQLSGSVTYNISSQFANEGMILKAFGNFPERYLLRISPTLKNMQGIYNKEYM